MNEITTEFRAVCEECGHEGAYVRTIDALGFVSGHWDGFVPPTVAKLSSRAEHYAALMNPKCLACGASAAVVGEPVTDKWRRQKIGNSPR